MLIRHFALSISFFAVFLCLSGGPNSGLALNQTEEPPRPDLYLQSSHTGTGDLYLAGSPDGRWLASRSVDKIVKLWDVATGRQLRTLASHVDSIASIASSPDGQLLASASADHTVKIWDVGTGKEIRTLEFKVDPSSLFVNAGPLLAPMYGQVRAVAFSPDGHSVAAGTNEGTVVLWDIASGQEISRMGDLPKEIRKGFTALGFSPNGRYLATAEEGGFMGGSTKVMVWDVATHREAHRFEGLPNIVNAVAFSPDSQLLAASMSTCSGSLVKGEATVKMWSVGNWREVQNISLERGKGAIAHALAFSPDGKTFASGSGDGILRLWGVSDGREFRSFKEHTGAVTSVVFGPDGAWVASAGTDKVIKIREVGTGREIRTMSGGALASPIIVTGFSGDGHSLVSVGRRPTRLAGNVWDIAMGGVERTLPIPGDVVGVSISADGRLLAAAGGKMLEVVQTNSGQVIFALPKADVKGIWSVAISPDARWIATGSDDGSIKLWDASAGREIRTLRGHSKGVSSLAFSSNGDQLVSGSYDKTVKVWDVAKGRELGTIKPGNDFVVGVALSPDARLVALADMPGQIQLWEVATFRKLRTFQGHRCLFGSTPLVFSRDGTRFIYAKGNDICVMQVVREGEELTLCGHTNEVKTFAFSHDGRYLVSGSHDGTLRLWDLNSGEPLALLFSPLESREWVVATPDGLFDGSPAAFKDILWRFKGNTFDVSPVEIFFNEYYYPGLLGDLLAGKKPRAPRDISQKDRRQPQVKLALVGGQAGSMASRTVAVTLEVTEAPPDQTSPLGSGARDVRLFRNGSLVKVWRGEVLGGKGNKVTLETTLPVVAGENRLTAYAFSAENIKSSDATLVVTGSDSLKRPGTAYILAVGVNQYENNEYNLNYAMADAQAFSQELQRQQTKLQSFGSVQVISLLNREATKANILCALTRLAGTDHDPLPAGAPGDLAKLKPAEPEDAVFVYYAGHGTAAGARFYLIPHDLGYPGPRDALDKASLGVILTHSISDVELEQAFERIDASRLMLVIDACNSGQALETEEKRRGPMNSKGLAQLAYEKGMYILTAAQSYQAALEATQLEHGFLTYALVEEGLKTPAADTAPIDGQVELREWLDYATLRVPQMQEIQMQEARKSGRDLVFVEGEQNIREIDKRSLQRPRVFYRRDPESQLLIVAKPEAKP